MYFRSLLYGLPNAPMIMQLTLEILISRNLRLTFLNMSFSGNAHSQAILGFSSIFYILFIHEVGCFCKTFEIFIA